MGHSYNIYACITCILLALLYLSPPSFPEFNDYHKDGFLLVRSLVEPAAVHAMLDAQQEVIAQTDERVQVVRERDGITVRSVMGHQWSHPQITSLVTSPAIVDVVRSLLKTDNVYITQFKVNVKQPVQAGGRPWQAHRDYAFWHVLDGFPSAEDMVSVFIFASPQTDQNGAINVLAGSHRATNAQVFDEAYEKSKAGDATKDTAEDLSLALNPDEFAAFRQAHPTVAATGKVGDVFFMHANTIHWSGDNLGSDPRILSIVTFSTCVNQASTPRPYYYLVETNATPIAPYGGESH
mmetsp:Transcript_11206/g.35588  ORF Transcript_11206/g.35588 Transcript_11206/m.35588 type:complete len:294 (-) Transcript_11206:125-1006(-)